MRTWIATVDVSMTLTEDDTKWFPIRFADPSNPTAEELERYFQDRLESLAGSNDGSELLANATFSISERIS